MSNEVTGRCLCGAVKLIAHHHDVNVGACHCHMCRRWGGGPLIAIDCGTDVGIEGKEDVRVFDSSAWAERGFCKDCGTHLFYRLKESGQYFIPAGLFDEDPQLTFDNQVFIDEKPDYYEFANKTRNLTGKEVFERYS